MLENLLVSLGIVEHGVLAGDPVFHMLEMKLTACVHYPSHMRPGVRGKEGWEEGRMGGRKEEVIYMQSKIPKISTLCVLSPQYQAIVSDLYAQVFVTCADDIVLISSAGVNVLSLESLFLQSLVSMCHRQA